jgi:hypothetical protein
MATATLSDFRNTIHDLRNGVASWKSLSNAETATDSDKEMYAALICEYTVAIADVFANRHGTSFPANVESESTETENDTENDTPETENDTPESTTETVNA